MRQAISKIGSVLFCRPAGHETLRGLSKPNINHTLSIILIAASSILGVLIANWALNDSEVALQLLDYLACKVKLSFSAYIFVVSAVFLFTQLFRHGFLLLFAGRSKRYARCAWRHMTVTTLFGLGAMFNIGSFLFGVGLVSFLRTDDILFLTYAIFLLIPSIAFKFYYTKQLIADIRQLRMRPMNFRVMQLFSIVAMLVLLSAIGIQLDKNRWQTGEHRECTPPNFSTFSY